MKRVILILMVLTLVSCGSDSKEGSGKQLDNFNRKEMLTFWADKIIIPSYADFLSKTKSLDTAIKTFTKSPSSQNLTAARKLWKEAYISWQKVSLFQIGKAQDLNMTGNMNTYPTDVNSLTKYVKEGNYNLESPNLYDEQGFPALDYLLNGVGSDEETIAFYTKAKEASKFKDYIVTLSGRINKLTEQVYNSWKKSYRDEFIANSGYTTTSSVDEMVNYYVVTFYEKQFRENKIATPAGVRTSVPVPTAVEAYYTKGLSKELYLTTLTTLKNFFNGVAYDGTKGKSLQQYLEFLKRQDLAVLINTKFDKLISLSNTLDADFTIETEVKVDKEGNVTEVIIKDKAKRNKMLNTFDAIQTILKSFKPDMMSAMSIKNTSTDADND